MSEILLSTERDRHTHTKSHIDHTISSQKHALIRRVNIYYDYYYHYLLLIFADLKIFRVINSPHYCLLLQSDINSVTNWCTANSMRLNTAKTRVVSCTRKTNILSYEHQLCRSTIPRTSSIKDLGVFFDSKLHFHSHVDYVFSECMKLLCLIRSITYRCCSLECLYILYFTLVRSRLEYASVVWNSYHFD
jgi:hypothetical protein